jgi:macrolide-specific efflux system membrane fusion protein
LKRKRKTFLWLLLLACILTAAGIAWKLAQRKNAADLAPATAKVTRRDLNSAVLATGAVKPQIGAEVRVGARISGKVERLHANIGDNVKKGQIIAELEKADLIAAVNQRKAELELAEKELARQEELLKQDFTPQQTRDEARARWAVAKAALEGAQVQESYATITAPIDGVIASVSTQEGETVAAGLSAPTFVTIIDLRRLQVDTFVDEVDIGKVHSGQKAVFTVDAFPAREFEGKVVAIYPKAVIQENVVNYDVVVQITGDPESVLRPEMTASVTLFQETRQNVLTVPVKAVKRENGKPVVYVAAGGRTEPRSVKTGWKDAQWIEIQSGLEEGQSVLVETATPSNNEQ